MHRWIKFGALFMLAFVLFDVCTPESCAMQISLTKTDAQFQAQGTGSDSDTCQFEEDCLACAHFVPGTTVALQSLALASIAEAEVQTSALAGTPLLHYHPPRA